MKKRLMMALVAILSLFAVLWINLKPISINAKEHVYATTHYEYDRGYDLDTGLIVDKTDSMYFDYTDKIEIGYSPFYALKYSFFPAYMYDEAYTNGVDALFWDAAGTYLGFVNIATYLQTSNYSNTTFILEIENDQSWANNVASVAFMSYPDGMEYGHPGEFVLKNDYLPADYDTHSFVVGDYLPKTNRLMISWDPTDANTFTITFDSNGGHTIEDQTIEYGGLIEYVTDFRNDFDFDGWYAYDGEEEFQWDFHTMTVDQDWELIAKWVKIFSDEMVEDGHDIWLKAVQLPPNTYTVTFDSNGGTSYDPLYIEYGEHVDPYPGNPSKEGHTFEGWYTDEDVWEDEWNFGSDTVTGDLTLYAYFEPIMYTVSFYSDFTEWSPPQVLPYGSLVTKPEEIPTKENWVFLYWKNSVGAEVDFDTFTVWANHPFSPFWVYSNYIVTFDSNGGSTIESIDGLMAGDSISEPASPVKDGYLFEGWFTDSELTEAFDFGSDTIPGHTTLYADWDPDDFTITFDTNNGSEIAAITQAYGSDVEAPDDPTRLGHTFVGWYSDVELATEYVFTTIPAGDITVYAKWTVNTYTITYDSNEGSLVGPQVYDYAEATEAPEEPTKGEYTFAGWYSDEELTTAYVFTTMPAENITLYAKWVLYEDVPPTPATTDFGGLFLQYWWVLVAAAGGIAVLYVLFSTKPKRRRYRRRY